VPGNLKVDSKDLETIKIATSVVIIVAMGGDLEGTGGNSTPQF